MASDLNLQQISASLRPAVNGPSPAAVTALADAESSKVTQSGKDLPPKEAEQETDRQALDRAVSEMNNYVQNVKRDLQFSVDDDSGRIIVKVIDSESKEVIRQIPPEELLSLARNLESGDGAILVVKA